MRAGTSRRPEPEVRRKNARQTGVRERTPRDSRASARARGPRGRAKAALTVLTIGHSTRTIEDFVRLLEAHQVQRLVDVRTVPRSRHNPQFNRETLPESLRKAGIHYTHLQGLGGLRHARKDSVNLGWRNASFCGYADYMQTTEFEGNLEKLLEMARRERVAIMCAEAVPWRCHRSLIADALLARGVEARHIASAIRAEPHRLTPWAVVKERRITYPAASLALPFESNK